MSYRPHTEGTSCVFRWCWQPSSRIQQMPIQARGSRQIVGDGRADLYRNGSMRIVGFQVTGLVSRQVKNMATDSFA